MLKELKFVQGAVAKKDFLPAMTHFKINRTSISAYNGTLALSAPLPIDLECKPKAAPFVQAIAKCTETVAFTMLNSNRLRIQSGNFKAFVDCIDGDTPHVEPEGEEYFINGEQLLRAFKILIDFIGDDASRPWSNGILLKGQSAFATNNVCLIEYWLGFNFPHVINIPLTAIREIIRVDEIPTFIQIAEKSITFHYPDGKWIRSQLYVNEWPDLSRILDRPSNPQPLDLRLFEGLETLKPFTNKLGQIFFNENYISTSIEATEGASYEIDGYSASGIYQIEMLERLNGVATQIDFSTYPAPCMFFGDKLRGAIIGMNL